MIKGVSHVAINTSDINRSVQFYHEMLGFAIDEDLTLPNGVRIVHMEIAPGSTLELFGRPQPVEPPPQGVFTGIVHVALSVDSVDRLYEELRAKGVEFTGPPRAGSGRSRRLVFLRDPDGTLLELIER